MTIAVDWDVKQHNKQTNKRLREDTHLYRTSYMRGSRGERRGVKPSLTPEISQIYRVSYHNWSESNENYEAIEPKFNVWPS